MPDQRSPADPPPRRVAAMAALLPGLAFVAAVSLLSLAVAALENRAFGHPIIEALVVAIVLGMIVRALWTPTAPMQPGVRFAAKEVLEIAVCLLGASVDLPLLLRAGPALALGIVMLVVLGLAASYALGVAVGLPVPLAILVACGNSICGNSAIAAVAPVIGADDEHIASSIAFTAVLGVGVVLGLPLLIHPLRLSDYQYGVLAGLTVYAVPQVLAAAFPVSVLSGQVGTLVKLVRVLMLGPVVLFFSLRHAAVRRTRVHAVSVVPWFIVGFLALAAIRAAGLLPDPVAGYARVTSGWLTVGAMAALGLGVDVHAVRGAGRAVVTAVTGSLVILLVLAVLLIRLLGIA